MQELSPDHPLRRLFHQLRRRNFMLGPDDLLALHYTLAEGFGWTSRAALRDVCRALWAKSRDEQLVLDSLFDQLVKEDWRLAFSEVATSRTGIEEKRDPGYRPQPHDRPA